MSSLYLDSNIRDWVFIPIILVSFVSNILRANIANLTKSDRKQKESDIKENQQLMRARILRASHGLIPPGSFNMRRHFFCNEQTGVFKEDPERKPANPAADPDAMSGMLKDQFTTMVPQIALFTWVTNVFHGFLTTKVPFPLTLQFKQMTQRGVELVGLDPSWISSMSWYFLIAFGLRGIQTLVMGADNVVDESQMMKQQMGAGGNPNAPKPDMNQVFKAEREALDLVEYKFSLENVEARLLGLEKAPGH
eukprot:comp12825_c0_seq1/m.7979 comp12825_c0_seq1/g.7979  ORF comp12825_c0_seq1/g.7979 comp12825_c0_seq1/m.7979 type:complete len:250 (-) comp12825_c0_seq1:74-823(-)